MKRAFPSTAVTSLSVFSLLLQVAAPTLANSATSRNVESVTVEAQKILPGIWRFPPHERQTYWTMSGANFSVMGPQLYCRIGLAPPGYTFNCFELAERSAQARLDADAEGHVNLRWNMEWGTSGCHWTFRGSLQSDTEISGYLGSECGGENRDDPRRMTITKMALPESTTDAGGQSAFMERLLTEMTNGQVTEPYVRPRFVSSNPDVVPLPDAAQRKFLEFLAPDSLRALGKVTAVIYVDDYYPIVGWESSPARNGPVYGDEQFIYAVEFENGERLCTLHRQPNGILDQFECI